MNKEKMLYHAKHNGKLSFTSKEFAGQIASNLRFLIDGGFLKWETNTLWDEYSSCGEEDLYEDAWHQYSITPNGEVLLAIYRLEYTYKNHYGKSTEGTEKHNRRAEEFNKLIQYSSLDLEGYKKYLTKNQIKAMNNGYAISNPRTPDQQDEDAITLSPYKISEVALGTLEKRLDSIDLTELSLESMFNMSTGLGQKDHSKMRTEEYVLRKVNEELGEMTLEMNIRDGLSYKTAGSDGVKGEAVDLAICALDMFALQCDNMTSEEMEREFLSYMLVKLNKWRDSLK